MIDPEKIKQILNRELKGYCRWRRKLPNISFTYDECISLWHDFRKTNSSFTPYNLNRWIEMIENRKFNPDCPLEYLGRGELYSSFNVKREIYNELELIKENKRYYNEVKFIAALVHYTLKALQKEKWNIIKNRRERGYERWCRLLPNIYFSLEECCEMWYHLNINDPWVYSPSLEKCYNFFKQENLDKIKMHARMAFYNYLEEKSESYLYSEDYVVPETGISYNEYARQKAREYKLEAILYYYTLKAIKNLKC